MKRQLERPALYWGEAYASLPLAVYGAIRNTRKRAYTLTEIAVHTMQAFWTSADRGTNFTGAFDLEEVMGMTLDNLGFDTAIIHKRKLPELMPELHGQALSLIRDSIGRGIPVIGHNLENYEYGLIYGYDDETAMLQICDVSAQKGKELPYSQLGKRPLHGTPIPPKGQQNDSYRATLRTTLGFLIGHMTGRERDAFAIACTVPPRNASIQTSNARMPYSTSCSRCTNGLRNSAVRAAEAACISFHASV